METIKVIFMDVEDKYLFLTGGIFRTSHFMRFKREAKNLETWGEDNAYVAQKYIESLGISPLGPHVSSILNNTDKLGGCRTKHFRTMTHLMRSLIQHDGRLKLGYKERFEYVYDFIGRDYIASLGVIV